ncbi:OLC1v1026614C1 [Oldenlandia corymbosa var. corymbosa]|uniref:OLC1v1026614C1 n=1 Tax=Oldenlandia corymbosa var. corymbosa TaxID=529605 RepID=A0AAV1CA92_OLDCO|nr:OLC1v1026614C1 [Oldenlandia corymbosa var. corymbosa]
MSAQLKKISSSVEVKADGNVFHEIGRDGLYRLPTICPRYVEGVVLHEGEWGKVGYVIIVTYNLDGRKIVMKNKVEAIDDAKRSSRYRAMDGELLAMYKTFAITYQVDTDGEGGKSLVTWTIEYEKINESIPDPNAMMELCINATRNFESYQLNMN